MTERRRGEPHAIEVVDARQLATPIDWQRWERAVVAWLLAVENRSTNTRAAYQADVELWQRWCVANDVLPWHATRSNVNAYGRALIRSGYQPRTVARKLASLSSLYEHITTDDDDPFPGLRNPARNATRPAVGKDHRTAPLSIDEARRILAAARDSSPRDYALVKLLATTAMRVTEAVAAKVADYTTHDGAPAVSVVRKGGRRVWIKLDASTAAAVDSYLDGRRYGPLFLAKTGAPRPLTRQAAASMVTWLAGRAGVNRPVTPHVLRHTVATDLLDQGFPLTAVQHLLGHTSPRTTLLYTHNDMNESARMSAAMADRLEPDTPDA